MKKKYVRKVKEFSKRHKHSAWTLGEAFGEIVLSSTPLSYVVALLRSRSSDDEEEINKLEFESSLKKINQRLDIIELKMNLNQVEDEKYIVKVFGDNEIIKNAVVYLSDFQNMKYSAKEVTKLGLMYEKGLEINSNYSKAIELYKEGVQKGDSTAMINLAWMYQWEINGKEECYYQSMKELFYEAIEEGKHSAIEWLNLMCSPLRLKWDDKILEEKKYAQQLYEKAIEKGNDQAMVRLAWMYENGIHVEKKLSKARELYQRAIESGNSTAMWRLGFMYQLGIDLSGEDEVKLRKLYEYEIEGSIGRCDRIKIFLDRRPWMKDRNAKRYLEKSIRLYEQSMEKGNTQAMLRLAWMYKCGYGVKKNFKSCERLLERAAGMGDRSAMFQLGLMCENSIGLGNYKKAIDYYKKSAEKGNERSIVNLALKYKNGEMLERDYVKSRMLFEKAAEMGNAKGFYNLGLIYENGLGVEKNYEKALELYESAWFDTLPGRHIDTHYDMNRVKKCLRKENSVIFKFFSIPRNVYSLVFNAN